MNCPEDKDVTRISFWVGEKEFFIEDEQLKNYQDNISSSAVIMHTHGCNYKPVDWSTGED